MMLLAIDPGTSVSGWLVWNMRAATVEACAISPNDDLLLIMENPEYKHCAIEMIASYGMPVGKEVFETCLWIGRYIERWTIDRPHGKEPDLIYRRDVKLHICGSARAKDPNVRQALLDKLGPVGTKKNPGPLYGVSSHIWSALAVAVTALKL